MHVKVTKLSKNENPWVDGANFRNGVDGWLTKEPEIHEQIRLFHSSEDDATMLVTTPVEELHVHPKGWIVHTLNSVYAIEKQ